MFRLLLVTSALAWTVSVAPAEVPIDFDTQVMPILTRHGCNAGSCHGAAIGRGGFHLSLLGGDAEADYRTIRFAFEGRRVNLHEADRSLLLRKPSEQLGHEGGEVLPEATSDFATVHRWIAQGADRLQLRSLEKLSIDTRQQDGSATPQVSNLGDQISLKVTATYDDGTQADVTPQTILTANDPESVAVDQDQGTLTLRRRGVHVVVARHLDRVLPVRLIVPFHDTPQGGAIASPSGLNPIDEKINRQLRLLNLPASPLADDYQFLRRVTLDLTGRLPSPSDIRQFVQDDATDKRNRKISTLLRDDDFAVYWGLKWANILAIDSKQLQSEGADAFHRWFAGRLADDAPLDESVRQMVTAVGDSFEQGAANFVRIGKGPGETAEYASRLFMGARLRCANCHDHPLDHWRQDDYHGLAAIFAKVSRGRVVADGQRGEVTHPVTGQPAREKIPGGRYLNQDESPREALAEWLTSRETPYLATVTVNRLWQQLLGRGLVEPVDDIRVTNPASHPELLRWLAEDFAANGYRLRHTIALICASDTYQRTSTPLPGNATDETFYSHALQRGLEAEVIADAIGDVTGKPISFPGVARAVALTDNRLATPNLDVLGRCDRQIGCGAFGRPSVSLTRSLHLINGPLLNDRISASDGKLHQWLEQLDDAALIDELYLSTLSRPAGDLRSHWENEAAESPPSRRTEFFEDLLWGLMTSDSFVTNH